MIAPAAEQTLIPSAACFHIGYGNQRLRTHSSRVSPVGERPRFLQPTETRAVGPLKSASRRSASGSRVIQPR